MKLLRLVSPAVMALVASAALPASAETVSAQYNGINTSGTAHIYRDGGYFGNFYAAEMSLSLDGVVHDAYCIDLDHSIAAGQSYTATLELLPNESPYCEMAYILANYDAGGSNYWGSVIQVAMWKLVYDPDPWDGDDSPLYVGEADIEAGADALIAEAEGQCVMSCTGDPELTVDLTGGSGGTVTVSVNVSQGATPVAGQAIALTASSGTLSDAVVVTDAAGNATATVTGPALPLTVDATTEGLDVYEVIPETPVQALAAFIPTSCVHDGTGSFAGAALGNPSTIGFWKHQVKVWSSGKGNAQVDSSTIASWLPLGVFDAAFDSLQSLYDALWIENNSADMDDRAVQQCLGTTLNVAYGQLDWWSLIDLGGDGVDDGYFWEFWDDAEAAWDAGDYETAKTICDTINNL